MVDADGTLGDLLSGNSGAGSGDLDVEIHTVDTSAGVVLQTKIDVLLDTESESTVATEVLVLEFVLLDLQTLLEDLLGLLTSDSDVASDLVVTTDAETSDSVPGYEIE